MSTSISREALAERVRKLQKMTTANGCSEAEAAFAAQKIAAIMAEHALTQDELSLKEDTAHCIQDEFLIWGRDYGDWWKLQQSVARLFDCKCWGMRARLEEMPDLGISHPVKPFVFYGMPYDVVACISVMSICFSAVSTTMERERGKRQDFAIGMVARLCQRIDEMKPKRATGTGLIVLKGQLVDAAFAQLGLKIRNVKVGARSVDAAAYAKGFAEGAHVNLSGGRNATTTSAAPRQLGAR